MEMAVVKERKFEEESKFLIEPLNILRAVNVVNSGRSQYGKKKLRLGFTFM
jgi:hypothetical protein